MKRYLPTISFLVVAVVMLVGVVVVNPQGKAACPYTAAYYRAQILLEQIKIDDARVVAAQASLNDVRSKIVDLENDKDRVAKSLQDHQDAINNAASDTDTTWDKDQIDELRLQETANERTGYMLNAEAGEAWAAFVAAQSKLANDTQELENVKLSLNGK